MSDTVCAELAALRPHAIETMEPSPEEMLDVAEQGLIDDRFPLGWEPAA